MLEIKVRNPGAELTSVKFNGKERLHDGKTFWDRQAPILLPTVGRLRDNKTVIEGKEYKYLAIKGYCKICNNEISVNDLLDKKLNNSPYGEKLVTGSTGSYVKAESTYDAATRQTTTTFSICLVDTAGNAVASATTSNDKITALNLIDESTLSADNTYANVHVSSGVTVSPTIPE